MEPSTRARWRRRIAPLGVALGLGFLAWQLWRRDVAVVEATVTLDFGDRVSDVLAVDLDIRSGTSSVGNFHREAVGASMGRPWFRVKLPEEDVTFVAVIRLRGAVRTIERPVHVPDDGAVIVDLGGDLERAAP